MKKKRLILTILCFLAGAFMLYVCVELIHSNDTIGVTRYEVSSSKIEKPITIVQITDLHNYSFGTDNEHLVRITEEQSPDIIVMTGDMILHNDPKPEITIKLCERLLELAPVYFSLGNHETGEGQDFVNEFTTELENVGVIVLEREYLDIEVNGNAIRIGGVSGYAYTNLPSNAENEAFMYGYEGSYNFKLLLAHQPESMVAWGGMEAYEVDLTLSGHTHGGQVRLPLIGAVYAPDQGGFPEYAEGIFYKGSGAIIISRGLGSSGIVPRMWNQPELTVIRLSSEDSD
ncbi:MAG: metallophosphoesterase [Clostridia bacterium]|nr:metallophosphoesterase [Clostridia bacterium]